MKIPWRTIRDLVIEALKGVAISTAKKHAAKDSGKGKARGHVSMNDDMGREG